jgi:hypothetical protein
MDLFARRVAYQLPPTNQRGVAVRGSHLEHSLPTIGEHMPLITESNESSRKMVDCFVQIRTMASVKVTFGINDVRKLDTIFKVVHRGHHLMNCPSRKIAGRQVKPFQCGLFHRLRKKYRNRCHRNADHQTEQHHRQTVSLLKALNPKLDYSAHLKIAPTSPLRFKTLEKSNIRQIVLSPN